MLQGTETRDGCAKLSLPIGGEGNMHSPFSSFPPHQIVLCIGLVSLGYQLGIPSVCLLSVGLSVLVLCSGVTH